MARSSSYLFLLPLLLAGSILGCNPKIGDDCSTSTDCSISGDRLCDTTQPGGYCTIFNCEPDTCPEESQCIAFDTELDPACADQRWARFERTFCMRRCKDNGDCRSGYVCFNMNSTPNPWGARVADLDPEGTKVCIAPWSEASPGVGLTEVCSPYEGEFPDAGSTSTPDAADAQDAIVEDSTVDADGSDQPDASEDAKDAGEDAQDAGEDAQDAGEDAS